MRRRGRGFGSAPALPMRVRVVRQFVSMGGAYYPGEVVELPEETAREWLRIGHVERMPPEPEKAVRAIPETAVTRGGR